MTTLEIPIYGLDRAEMRKAQEMLDVMKQTLTLLDNLRIITNAQLRSIRAPQLLDLESMVADEVNEIEVLRADIERALRGEP